MSSAAAAVSAMLDCPTNSLLCTQSYAWHRYAKPKSETIATTVPRPRESRSSNSAKRCPKRSLSLRSRTFCLPSLPTRTFSPEHGVHVPYEQNCLPATITAHLASEPPDSILYFGMLFLQGS